MVRNISKFVSKFVSPIGWRIIPSVSFGTTLSGTPDNSWRSPGEPEFVLNTVVVANCSGELNSQGNHGHGAGHKLSEKTAFSSESCQ